MTHLWLIHVCHTTYIKHWKNLNLFFVGVLLDNNLKKHIKNKHTENYILKTDKYKCNFLEDQVTLVTTKAV